MTNYFNTDPEDGFNPEDHEIEMDEKCLKELESIANGQVKD